MKQRISSLDIKLLTSELEADIKGYRLQNIYNLLTNNKGYLLKFAITDSKRNLVVDCGSKFYSTEFQRPTTPEPSNFVVKLRKHLKGKRLTNLKQLGNDRVVILEFSEGMYYLALEFFSAGNIVLLDQDLKILSLQRLVQEKENNDKYAVGEAYNAFDKSLFSQTSASEEAVHIFTEDEVVNWVNQKRDTSSNKVLSIHKLLFVCASYLSSDLIQIQLMGQEINPSESSLKLLEDGNLLEATVRALNAASLELHKILKASPHKGFIISKKNAIFDASKPESVEFIYDEFHPYLPVHKKIDHHEEVEGYNKTLDNFFTTIEANKNVLKEQQLQLNAEKRLKLVKDENLSKINKLEELQALNVKKAEAIMLYSDLVEQCKDAVQSLIDQQLDWQHIEKMIALQKKRKNEIAQHINLPLNLKDNKINLSLPDVDYDDVSESSDSDSESDSDSDASSDSNSSSGGSKKQPKTLTVTIDLSLSAFANSSVYFDAKRDAEQKRLKTEQNASLALKNTEKKISKDLKKAEKANANQTSLKHTRPKAWFEKFFWFISSDGYLCIAGRDDAQIDLIYYKHLNNENDYLVSNDFENSLKVVIKNPYKNKEIPPTSLIQAGIYSLSTTKAWDNKIVTSPWFVKAREVSKRDFDGSILGVGMLNVTKEKNFLPPAQLAYGIGFYWLGDEATAKKYVTNRINREDELGFKLVDDQEVISKKSEELKALLTKMEADYEKEVEKDKTKVNEVSDQLSATRVVELENEETKAPSPYEQTQAKVRGKKAKMKKIKQKYGDQDEEERRLRMQLLGSQKEKNASASVNGANSTDTSAAKKEGSANWRTLRKKQQNVNQLKKILQEFEDGEESADEAVENEDDRPQLVSYRESLDHLIASPLKTDIIEDVVPVFAPWSSLQKCKYKLKIQPGNLKKGKIISDLIEYYKKDHAKKLKESSDEWFDEKSLITDLNQQDLLLSISVNKMKLSIGNDTKKGKK